MNAQRLRRSRPGLTLVELLVVLVILAIMTVIAVQATEGLGEQARYEATRRTLENTQAAVLGAANQAGSDGTPLLTGFAADLGRSPIADVNSQIPELLLQGTLPNYRSVGVVAGDTNTNGDVTILAGWRGPYLRMPAPTSQGLFLYDGWGKPFALVNGANNIAAPGESVIAMKYAGSGVDSHSAALSSQPATALTNNPLNLLTTITGSVIDSDTTSPATNVVFVKLFFVDLARFDAGANTWTLASANPTQDPNGTGLSAPYTFTFTPKVNVNSAEMPATGNMVLRAWQVINNVVTKSSIVRIRVPAGGMMQDVRFDLR